MSGQERSDLGACLDAALGGDGPEDARWASALRVRCRLLPAGGPGSKVMPPTYSGRGRDESPLYVRERRRIGEAEHDCVLLDSVASQANRLEVALLDSLEAGQTKVPTIEVDQGEFGLNSALRFSHRCFDAWVEDAELDGRRFGDTDVYASLARASRRDVTALMGVFPVGIVLGCWASRAKDPQGTTRLARILVSEIVAVDAVLGERPASKIDVHPVSSSVKVYESADDNARFTLDESGARTDAKGKAVPFRGGRPSEAGYGNVTPSLASHGGITMDHALQIATVSVPALRECSFPRDGTVDGDRDVAGRAMLAALALRMLAQQLERGYDLRSGCLLVPVEDPAVELVGRLGQIVGSWPMIGLDTAALLERVADRGAEHGLAWDVAPVQLSASAPQLELLRQSLEHAEAEADA